MVGTITYSVNSNTITAVGGTSSTAISFTDLWNADQAGGWNVVHKQGSNQFLLDCKIQIGDGTTASYFTDGAVELSFSTLCTTTAYDALMRVKANATLTLGSLLDANSKATVDGVAILSLSTASGVRIILGEANSVVYLYSFQARSRSSNIARIVLGGTSRMWNALLSQVAVGDCSNVDVYNLYSANGDFGMFRCAGIFDTLTLRVGTWQAFGCDSGIAFSVKNVVVSGYPKLGSIYSAVDNFLINCVSDVWSFSWGAAGKVHRQYEFDLTVTDKNNNPLQAATVTLTDRNGTQIFTATTNANGAIATQTVSRGYYDQAHGDALQDSSPHTVTVSKAGYQNYVKKFTLSEKTKWQIKLTKAQPILLNLGKPAVNLRAVDSENIHILEL